MKFIMTNPRTLISALIVSTILAGPVTGFATTVNDEADWQPVASEKLIRMPAKYMNASIERNFQQSTLATGINALDAQIQMEAARMQESHQAIDGVEGEQAVELQHQLLMAKSNYLELMHDKHELSEQALNKKAALYQRVLKKLQQDKSRALDPVSAELIIKQKAARTRLNQAISDVDDVLLQTLPGKDSKYQQEYSKNLSKIEQLKQAIQQHGANEGPALDGQDMNREQYVRYLLEKVDSELALIDQERLMLGYMAKLVAMDVQSLEYEMSYGELDEEAQHVKEQVRLVNATDMFIN